MSLPYLSISLHVLQELPQQGEREVDVGEPELTETHKCIGGVGSECLLLSGVYVPPHQDVHRVLSQDKDITTSRHVTSVTCLVSCTNVLTTIMIHDTTLNKTFPVDI